MSRFDKESFETAQLELEQAKDRNRRLLVIGGLVSAILILLLLRQCSQTTHLAAKYEESDKNIERLIRSNKAVKQKIEAVEQAYKDLGQTYKNAFSKFGELTNAEQTTIDALLDNLIEKSDNFSDTVAEKSIVQLEKYLVIIRDRLANSNLKNELDDYKLRVETQRQTIEQLRTEVRKYEIDLQNANSELAEAKKDIAKLEDIIANNPNSPDAALRSQLADARAEIDRLKQEISNLQNGQNNAGGSIASNGGDGTSSRNESYEKDVDVRAYFIYKLSNNSRETEVTLDQNGIAKKYYKYFFKKNPEVYIQYRIDASKLAKSKITITIFDSGGNKIDDKEKDVQGNSRKNVQFSNRKGKYSKGETYVVSIIDDYQTQLIHGGGYTFSLKEKND